MIDIHNHILPGIDDGSKSLNESVEMIKNAYNAGVTDIILTPHFILNSSYSYESVQEQSILDDLKVKINEEGYNVNLFLGQEVFVEENLLELVQNKTINTLASSKYLLFELSLNNYYHGIFKLLFELNNNGIIPIIAHPERYTFLQENPHLVEEIYQHGALFQLDASSYYGKYGKKSKKLFTLMVKHHYASFIASDVHSKNDQGYTHMKSLKKDLEKYIIKEEIDILLNINPKQIINNNNIKKYDVTSFKKNIFNKWK